jgi:hypothetical protein
MNILSEIITIIGVWFFCCVCVFGGSRYLRYNSMGVPRKALSVIYSGLTLIAGLTVIYWIMFMTTSITTINQSSNQGISYTTVSGLEFNPITVETNKLSGDEKKSQESQEKARQAADSALESFQVLAEEARNKNK